VAGKTTNLRYIHANLAPDVKSEIVIRETEMSRYLFFDFLMPNMDLIRGHVPIFRLQCIPGCVRDWERSWQQVFVRVNAIVFVVDSHIDRLEGNLETLGTLRSLLCQQGHTLESIPWVIQYNKRDVSEQQIFPVQKLQQQLNWYSVPFFEAVAVQGTGVFETLKAIIDLAMGDFKKRVNHLADLHDS
jgi:hypothetical protein